MTDHLKNKIATLAKAINEPMIYLFNDNFEFFILRLTNTWLKPNSTGNLVTPALRLGLEIPKEDTDFSPI